MAVITIPIHSYALEKDSDWQPVSIYSKHNHPDQEKKYLSKRNGAEVDLVDVTKKRKRLVFKANTEISITNGKAFSYDTNAAEELSTESREK